MVKKKYTCSKDKLQGEISSFLMGMAFLHTTVCGNAPFHQKKKSTNLMGMRICYFFEKLRSLTLEGWNFACDFFLPFQNFFVSCLRKLLANWRNPRPHIAAAPAYYRGHEIKMVPNCKKMIKWEQFKNFMLKQGVSKIP